MLQLNELVPCATAWITVTGIVSPLLAVDALLPFQAEIGNQSFDSDLSNNHTLPITATAVVPRLRLCSASLSTDEGAPSVTVTVQLDQANPDAEVRVAYAISDARPQADSD